MATVERICEDCKKTFKYEQNGPGRPRKRCEGCRKPANAKAGKK